MTIFPTIFKTWKLSDEKFEGQKDEQKTSCGITINPSIKTKFEWNKIFLD